MKLYSHEKDLNLKDGLKRARTDAGLTQKQLADNIGVNVKTIMNWEQGKAEPSLSTLIDLAQYYKCDLDYLTGRIYCKTHNVQTIHDQTGLSEKAIRKLMHLNHNQTDTVSRIVEHKDFQRAVIEISDLSNKESVNAALSDMIKTHMIRSLRDLDARTAPINGNPIEKAMLYSISTKLTNIVCDVTGTTL